MNHNFISVFWALYHNAVFSFKVTAETVILQVTVTLSFPAASPPPPTFFCLSQPGQAPAPPTLPVPEDELGWVLEGLPLDVESEAYKRRHKHRGGKKFTLSGELKARLPKLDKAGLEVLRYFIDGKDKSLPFKFFEEAFPTTCQDIVLKEVRILVFKLELILLFVVCEKVGGLQHIPSLFSIAATSRLLALETCLDKRYHHGLQ